MVTQTPSRPIKRPVPRVAGAVSDGRLGALHQRKSAGKPRSSLVPLGLRGITQVIAVYFNREVREALLTKQLHGLQQHPYALAIHQLTEEAEAVSFGAVGHGAGTATVISLAVGYVVNPASINPP